MSIKVKDQITITIDIKLAKELMRLLIHDLNNCNVRSSRFINALETKKLYDALREVIGGRNYWEEERDYFKEKMELFKRDEVKRAFPGSEIVGNSELPF